VDFAGIFHKNVIITSQLIFFEFLVYLRPVLIVSYLQIQQTKNSLNYKSFTKLFLCDIQNLKTIGCARDL